VEAPRAGEQARQREVEFFDRFAAEHGDYDVLSEGAYRRLIDLFVQRVAPRRGERCIDLGCGTGAFTKRLAARGLGLDLTGMDISPASVARASEHPEGARFVVGDIMQTGLPEASHDIILYSGVLHHFDSPAARHNVLVEGLRILRPGGRLFAYDPNARSPSMWLYRDPRSPLFSSKGKTENEVLLKSDELAGELADAGFGDVSVRGVSGITFRYVDSGLARLVLPAYNVYEALVRRSPWEDRIGTFLVSTAVKPTA
jgi:ubiquinone/menaquinone biosynthesis C-methylase UbiE